MKNLIKNSMFGLMIVAVVGTQVQAVSMAMVQARMKTVLTKAKANPFLTAGAVVAGLVVFDGAQYSVKAFRNNRQAKALPAPVVVNEADLTAAVAERNAVDAELKAVQAKVAAAQAEKSKVEAEQAKYEQDLKAKADRGEKPTAEATVKKNKAKRQTYLTKVTAELQGFTNQQTDLAAKFAPLATKVTDLEAQKTAATKAAADAKALEDAKAKNGLYVTWAPRTVYNKLFKKADAGK